MDFNTVPPSQTPTGAAGAVGQTFDGTWSARADWDYSGLMGLNGKCKVRIPSPVHFLVTPP